MRRARWWAACGCIVFITTASLARRAPPDQYDLFDEFNETIKDKQTGLTWQRSVTTPMSLAAGQKYCSDYRAPETGWRIPTAKELMTLVDEDVDFVFVGNNTLEPRAIDDFAFPNTPRSYFWSSTASSGGDAIVIDFRYGTTTALAASTAVYTRCVQTP